MPSAPAPPPVWRIPALERNQNISIFYSLSPEDGLLDGDQARNFFIQSKLPMPDLSQIWSLADFDEDGSLSLPEFLIAMHLIKVKLSGAELPESTPEGLLPRQLRADEIPAISEAEMKAYVAAFEKLDSESSGFIQGDTAKPLLKRSYLPVTQLARVWSLADMDFDGQLAPAEFALCMHLMRFLRRGDMLPNDVDGPSLVQSYDRLSAVDEEKRTEPAAVDAAPTVAEPSQSAAEPAAPGTTERRSTTSIPTRVRKSASIRDPSCSGGDSSSNGSNANTSEDGAKKVSVNERRVPTRKGSRWVSFSSKRPAGFLRDSSGAAPVASDLASQEASDGSSAISSAAAFSPVQQTDGAAFDKEKPPADAFCLTDDNPFTNDSFASLTAREVSEQQPKMDPFADVTAGENDPFSSADPFQMSADDPFGGDDSMFADPFSSTAKAIGDIPSPFPSSSNLPALSTTPQSLEALEEETEQQQPQQLDDPFGHNLTASTTSSTTLQVVSSNDSSMSSASTVAPTTGFPDDPFAAQISAASIGGEGLPASTVAPATGFPDDPFAAQISATNKGGDGSPSLPRAPSTALAASVEAAKPSGTGAATIGFSDPFTASAPEIAAVKSPAAADPVKASEHTEQSLFDDPFRSSAGAAGETKPGEFDAFGAGTASTKPVAFDDAFGFTGGPSSTTAASGFDDAFGKLSLEPSAATSGKPSGFEDAFGVFDTPADGGSEKPVQSGGFADAFGMADASPASTAVPAPAAPLEGMADAGSDSNFDQPRDTAEEHPNTAAPLDSDRLKESVAAGFGGNAPHGDLFAGQDAFTTSAPFNDAFTGKDNTAATSMSSSVGQPTMVNDPFASSQGTVASSSDAVAAFGDSFANFPSQSQAEAQSVPALPTAPAAAASTDTDPVAQPALLTPTPVGAPASSTPGSTVDTTHVSDQQTAAEVSDKYAAFSSVPADKTSNQTAMPPSVASSDASTLATAVTAALAAAPATVEAATAPSSKAIPPPVPPTQRSTATTPAKVRQPGVAEAANTAVGSATSGTAAVPAADKPLGFNDGFSGSFEPFGSSFSSGTTAKSSDATPPPVAAGGASTLQASSPVIPPASAASAISATTSNHPPAVNVHAPQSMLKFDDLFASKSPVPTQTPDSRKSIDSAFGISSNVTQAADSSFGFGDSFSASPAPAPVPVQSAAKTTDSSSSEKQPSAAAAAAPQQFSFGDAFGAASSTVASQQSGFDGAFSTPSSTASLQAAVANTSAQKSTTSGFDDAFGLPDQHAPLKSSSTGPGSSFNPLDNAFGASSTTQQQSSNQTSGSSNVDPFGLTSFSPSPAKTDGAPNVVSSAFGDSFSPSTAATTDAFGGAPFGSAAGSGQAPNKPSFDPFGSSFGNPLSSQVPAAKPSPPIPPSSRDNLKQTANRSSSMPPDQTGGFSSSLVTSSLPSTQTGEFAQPQQQQQQPAAVDAFSAFNTTSQQALAPPAHMQVTASASAPLAPRAAAAPVAFASTAFPPITAATTASAPAAQPAGAPGPFGTAPFAPSTAVPQAGVTGTGGFGDQFQPAATSGQPFGQGFMPQQQPHASGPQQAAAKNDSGQLTAGTTVADGGKSRPSKEDKQKQVEEIQKSLVLDIDKEWADLLNSTSPALKHKTTGAPAGSPAKVTQQPRTSSPSLSQLRAKQTTAAAAASSDQQPSAPQPTAMAPAAAAATGAVSQAGQGSGPCLARVQQPVTGDYSALQHAQQPSQQATAGILQPTTVATGSPSLSSKSEDVLQKTISTVEELEFIPKTKPADTDTPAQAAAPGISAEQAEQARLERIRSRRTKIEVVPDFDKRQAQMEEKRLQKEKEFIRKQEEEKRKQEEASIGSGISARRGSQLASKWEQKAGQSSHFSTKPVSTSQESEKALERRKKEEEEVRRRQAEFEKEREQRDVDSQRAQQAKDDALKKKAEREKEEAMAAREASAKALAGATTSSSSMGSAPVSVKDAASAYSTGPTFSQPSSSPEKGAAPKRMTKQNSLAAQWEQKFGGAK
eukprot:scpid7299/ scgid1623/ Epidermal growth factor receptor substrate 15; Protein AF-1p